ncbi:MAG: class A beta-lactamase-related serine hydrolase [Candidatus Pacearchaeota archaeon]|nr:class A beta-lactamase-related serine hydrolase [Candidatus Pacearchaeota archaeon]
MEEASSNQENSPEKNAIDNIPKENLKKSKRIDRFPILILCLLVLSLAFNVFLVLRMNHGSISGASFYLIKSPNENFIDSNVQNQGAILHYVSLKPIIEQEIRNYDTEENVGIFVQDIKTGSWLGINEKKGFFPASLLKITIMMAILKKVQNEELKLTDEIILTEKDLDERAGDLYRKGTGAKVSISQLLEAMITFSDNTAMNALKRQLSFYEYDSIFVHVGIPNPYVEYKEEVSSGVTPRGMIRIFKSLYFSTFLLPSFSEMALDLTTDTQEEELIPRGVPSEIQVAHKFGMSIVEGEEVLHDCGIVYHPKNPYFICVMTKDLELEKSKELIYKISKDVFDFVESSS